MPATSTTPPANRAEHRAAVKRPPSADLCQYVTIQQAASAWQVDPKTVRRKIAEGTLPAVRVGIRRPGTLRDTRPIRIPIDALADLTEPMNAPRAGQPGNPWGAQ